MSEQSQRSDHISILTDEEEKNNPIYFGSLSDVPVKVIKGSSPRFSIGVFGDWGTGKTTLMKLIESKLNEQNKLAGQGNNIVTVWFNAWRYEREEQFAIIPLLKTIAYAIPENTPELKELKQKIKKAGMNVLKKLPDVLPSLAKQFFGEGAEKFTDETVSAFKKEFIPKLELLTEVDKETIYYDGLDKISNSLSSIMVNPQTKSFRIVVFVDDLDRCSPERALEVFESVKVFLDIQGFIFVIGLSLTTIARLIEKKYEDADIKGRDYIRKIIQIPIFLPTWKADDIISIMDNLIADNRAHRISMDFLTERKDILKTAVEANPREIKRFINTFIVASELFSGSDLDKDALLLVQALQFRWDRFYERFISDEAFRWAILFTSSCSVSLPSLKRYVTGNLTDISQIISNMADRERTLLKEYKLFSSVNVATHAHNRTLLARVEYIQVQLARFRDPAIVKREYEENIKLLRDYFKAEVNEIQLKLWDFLVQYNITLSSITNWDDYRRAAEVSSDKDIRRIAKKSPTESVEA